MEGDTVWVAETWGAHGYGHCVFNVYDSREAAFEGLKTVPGMTVYVGEDGRLYGRPRHEDEYLALWGTARPRKVRGRECTPTATPTGAVPASQTREPSPS